MMVKFEVILENMTECQNPLPPFTKNRMIILDSKIHKNKSKTYLSGRNTVLTEVPFQNFSISTYTVDNSGRRDLKFQAQKLTCRHLVGRLFLEYGNFRYAKNNCRVFTGSFAYKDFDMDKVLHRIPNWHATGRLLHRVALTLKENTIFCIEFLVLIKNRQ
ncbi:uncharacterized protein [Choristoneura fumiferana]|uniref:uncharacterized protein n=1 Tax=Choristoneura fumiferana TaxID=7141 RepID=UPI003D159542